MKTVILILKIVKRAAYDVLFKLKAAQVIEGSSYEAIDISKSVTGGATKKKQ